jgi:hypothetical protein
MSPPTNEFESGLPPLSRRTLFTIAGVLAAATAVAADLEGPLAASAAIPAGNGYIYPTDPFRMSTESGGQYDAPRSGERLHKGIDTWGYRGMPILAVAAGRVVGGDWNSTGSDSHGWGHFVRVDHGNGVQTLYAHFDGAPVVTAGELVQQGQTLGGMGDSQYGPTSAMGVHLHFEVFVNGVNVHPLNFIQNAYYQNEDQMTPEQAALLAQVAADVKWIKDRIGGTVSSPTLASEFNVVRSRIGGEGATPNISQDVTWLKARIGGGASAPSITDQLRAIQGV